MGNLVLKWPVFNNTEKMKNFKIWDKWKKIIWHMFPIEFYVSTLILSHLGLISAEFYDFKKIHFVKFAHLERFSIVPSCTFFLWSRPEPPIQVRFSKTKFHAHLQTYRFHTNALDCCSVHPSWRSCAFKIGGTFFLGRRKYYILYITYLLQCYIYVIYNVFGQKLARKYPCRLFLCVFKKLKANQKNRRPILRKKTQPIGGYFRF